MHTFPYHRIEILSLRRCAAAVLLAGYATVASAQAIYKEVDSAGRVSYTDRAARSQPFKQAAISASDVSRALARNAAISSPRSAAIDSEEATRGLEQAERAHELGALPLPGENISGTQAYALNPGYMRRQEGLRRRLEQAQLRSVATARIARDARR
jgi:hypothetical protein